MVDISIIIPIYNVDSLLKKCLDSIVNQTLSGNFEVICVDDGSKDDSFFVAKEYEANYPNFKLLRHDVNQGLSKARLTGIKNANGRYIMHVDADDWIFPNTLNILLENCVRTDADVVVYNYTRVFENGRSRPVNVIKEKLFTQNKSQIQHLFYGTCVNKLVKKSILDDMVYGQDSINTSEDLLYSFEVLVRAKTFYLLPNSFYAYFQNKSSLTHQFVSESFLEQQTKIFEQLSIIFQRYSVALTLSQNLLNYNFKWINLNLAKSRFWFNKDRMSYHALECELEKFSHIDGTLYTRWLNASRNKYYALYLVCKDFGLRISAGILMISLLKRIKPSK